jgi:two-component system heavy metal sensor histidine kinase CusS
MSSKRVPDWRSLAGKRGSLSFRLTFWYALLSVVIVASAGSILYWVLGDYLRRDDDQWLAGQIAEFRSILSLHANDPVALRDALRRETLILPSSYLRVLDSNGNNLVETPAVKSIDFGSAASGLSARHVAPDEGADWIPRTGETYRVMYSRINAGPGFTVQVAINRSAEEEVLASYQYILWAVLSISLAVAIVAGYLIARRNLQPVSRLAAIIDELSATQLYRRIADDEWPAELRPLAANFDQLLMRLDDSFARISRFSADIAHELRTPLHILRGEAELALSKARSNDDYRECIVSATEEYDRLARMVDALLFLARTDSPESLPDQRTLILEEEIATVCAFYQALADEQETTLLVSGSAQISGDSALLRRALGNLIVNALRHTHCGGCIAIDVKQSPEGTVKITVTDTGDGISAQDLPHVFDRFYRADSARSGHGTGTGLGLAIVKSIMHLHGGSVSLSSEPGRGTVATLTFPALHPTP